MLSSCGGDDDDDNNDDDGPQPVTLTAAAGDDQTAIPGQSVTIDAGGSTGEGTLNYSWDYNGPGSIKLSDETEIETGSQGFTSSASFTFTPIATGEYTFTLTATSGNEFSNDQVLVTVAGAIEITSFTESSNSLKDVNFV